MRAHYIVAGHGFSVCTESESVNVAMPEYEPFRSTSASDPERDVFTLHVLPADDPQPEFTQDFRQEDDSQVILDGHSNDGKPMLVFKYHEKVTGWLLCSADYRVDTLYITKVNPKLVVGNALMILFALSTVDKKTVLFHASVVQHEQRAYLFLGVSGTGKSTHSRLWLKHIPETELINDDNPVVRVMDDQQVVVFGSPWSGKTPCYHNVSYLVGGMVMLRQAPHNEIRRMRGLEAYLALQNSIGGKRWDRQLANALHVTENLLATNVPTWHLDCLPDEDAARLCEQTIHQPTSVSDK